MQALPCARALARVSEAHVLTIESSYSHKAGTIILFKLEMKETRLWELKGVAVSHYSVPKCGA